MTASGPRCPSLSVLEAADHPADVAAHVRACRNCSNVLELLLERVDAVQARNRRNACARYEALIAARLEGTLNAADRELLGRHLGECNSCRMVADTVSGEVVPEREPVVPIIGEDAYELGAEVARGGMGRILVARDRRIGRRVAVKELLGRSSALAARFEREARVTARLQHPGIVPIYEIGRWADGTPFYSMRLIDGQTLRDALAATESLADRLALVPAVLAATEAVAFAHANAVIHRDLTPANILVGAHGDTVLIDWGLAKDLSERADDVVGDAVAAPYRGLPHDTDITVVGAILGTAAYMPPEQAAGASVDQRADVYSLGAILRHVLSGEPPYTGATADEILERVREGRLQPLSDDVPRDLVSIIDKAMAHSAEHRYPDAGALAADLRRFHTGKLVEAHHYSGRELARRWARRHRSTLAVALLALSAMVAGGAVAISNVIRERDRAAERQQEAMAARRIAETERNASEALSVTLLAEQGRRELLAGDALRALPFLSAAYSAGDDSAETRLMLAAAMAPVDDLAFEIPASGPVRRLSFSTLGERLMIARRREVDVWDVGTQSLVAHLRADGDDDFEDAVFSGDGRRVVAWTRGAIVRVFDVDARSAASYPGNERAIHSAALSRDGHTLHTIGWDRSWRTWDLRSGTARRVVLEEQPQQTRSNTIDLSPAGDRLLVFEIDGGVEVWETATARRVRRLAPSATRAAAELFDDGQRMIVCGLDNVARVVSVDTGVELARVTGPDDALVDCSTDDTSRRITLVGDAGSIAVWDESLDVELTVLEGYGGPANKVTRAAQGTLIVQTLGATYAIDEDFALLLRSYTFPRTASSTASDGSSFAIVAPDSAIRVFEVSGLRNRFVGPPLADIKARGDGGAIVGTSTDGRTRLYTPGGGELHVDDVLRGARSLIGDRLASVTDPGAVVVVDTNSGEVVRRWPSEDARPSLLQLSENGRVLLVATTAATEVRSVADGSIVARLAPSAGAPAMSLDGARVFTVTPGGDLVVWDAATGRQLSTMQLPGALAYGGVFPAPDGARVAVPHLGPPAAVSLIDAATGDEVASVPLGLPVFTSDTKVMFVVSSDAIMHVVSVVDGEVIAHYPASTSEAIDRVTADGLFAISASARGTTELRAVRDGRVVGSVRMRPSPPIIDASAREYRFETIDVSSATGDAMVVGADTPTASYVATVDIHKETRSPVEVAALVAARAPWRLVDGKLVPAAP